MVAAHSGALAGEDGAYEALFDAYGVARVDHLDEMADTCELLRRPPRRARRAGRHPRLRRRAGPPARRGRAAGVPFAEISEATRQRLAAVLEPGLPPTNPLDAWGTGNDADQIFAACIRALLEDPATAALALNLDLTTEPTPDTSYTGLAIAAAAATTKPVAVLSNLASAADPTEAATLRAAGVPVLEGTATGLAAFGHLFAYRDFARPRSEPRGGAVDNPPPPPPGSATLPHRGTRPGSAGVEAVPVRVGVKRARDRWRARLGERAPARAGAGRGRGAGPAGRLGGAGGGGRGGDRPGGGGGRGRAGWVAGGAEDGRARDRAQVGRWRGRAGVWTGPSGWPPPTPTWPAGWGRGCWWRPWPGPGWSWPLGWSTTPSSGRW